MTPEERRKFLAEHRLAVVGVGRKAAGPQLSPVYYVMDGGDLLISTTAGRAKAKAIARNPLVSVCVLGEAPPFAYLTVYGRGKIEHEGAAETLITIAGAVTGTPIAVAEKPAFEERARTEQRVVLRVTPESFFP